MWKIKNKFVSLKSFARWVPGTCLPSESNDISPNENLQQTNAIPFYEDIIMARSICDTVVKIQKRAEAIVSRILGYLLG